MVLELVLGVLLLLVVLVLYLRRNYGSLEKCGIPVASPSIFGLGSGPFMYHKV